MSLTASPVGMVYRFERFELDELALTFRVSGALVPLPIKPWATLLLLAQNAPDTVSKAELMDTVWLGRVVTEGVLTQVISRLRVLLGDDTQEWIKTVHGVGFRLTLPVTRGRDSALDAVAAPEFAITQATALRGRPLWALTQALSTSKRTAVWLAERKNDHLQRVFKFAHDGAGLRALKRELSVTRVLQAAQTASGICAVIDADFSEAPFFIELPYFNGGNLVDFYDTHMDICSEHKLAILIAIARTIADCHAVGIIHGDIKPKNILIELAADRLPLARLADFGAALLLDQARLKALELSAIHQTGLVVSDPGGGTLAYAAPELLAGKPATVATDAYAFGVTAFQLLCGEFSRPLSPGWEALISEKLLRQDISDMCQADPALRPPFGDIATRLNTLDARTETAIMREHELAEFEAVKADSARREQDWALDLARIDYLSQRRKMLWGVVIGLSILLAITSIALYWANQQRQLALIQSKIADAQTLLASSKATEAKKASKRADAVRESVMQSLVDATNPYSGGDPSVTVIELLEPLSKKLNSELKSEPAYVARISHSFAIALMLAKDYAGAERLYLSALNAAVPESERAESQMGLADVLMLQGRSADAIKSYFYAIQHSKDTVVQMRSNVQAATSYLRVGKPALALACIAAMRKLPVPPINLPDSFRFGTLATEGEALLMLGQLNEADTLFTRIIEQTELSSRSKGFAQLGISGLAKVQAARGNFTKAIELQEQAIDSLDERLPIGSRNAYEIVLATMLVDAKQYQRAKVILRRYLDHSEQTKKLGPYYLALAQEQLARIYLAHGKRAEATELLVKAKTGIESCLGQDSGVFARILALEKALGGKIQALR